ncbi:hypothetical protein ZWY2020_042807 [Hordeum vulgare]|nr:hypothetical protein ZWY2020_042807 [Hordeum vulgare]
MTSSPIPTTPATSSAPAPPSTSRLPFSFSTGCLDGSRTPASASAGTRPTRSALAAAAAASTSRRAPAPRAATPPPASASFCIHWAHGFQDRSPPNTTTSRGATDPSSYSNDNGEAEVDPNVHPEEDDGEDLFNDDYLK